jgi:rubrerythrin
MMVNEELMLFLAHSVELEAEARERYEELAGAMAQHHNAEVADFFERMAREASQHLAEVESMVGHVSLPVLKAWEFRWPRAEAPESASYEAVHYRMSLREAMNLALANEREAEQFYRQVAVTSDDPETQRIAGVFADEEASHAAALEKLLARQPPAPEHAREEDDEPHLPE